MSEFDDQPALEEAYRQTEVHAARGYIYQAIVESTSSFIEGARWQWEKDQFDLNLVRETLKSQQRINDEAWEKNKKAQELLNECEAALIDIIADDVGAQEDKDLLKKIQDFKKESN